MSFYYSLNFGPNQLKGNLKSIHQNYKSKTVLSQNSPFHYISMIENTCGEKTYRVSMQDPFICKVTGGVIYRRAQGTAHAQNLLLTCDCLRYILLQFRTADFKRGSVTFYLCSDCGSLCLKDSFVLFVAQKVLAKLFPKYELGKMQST